AASDAAADLTPTQDLGRLYGELLSGAWEVDVPETADMPRTEPPLPDAAPPEPSASTAAGRTARPPESEPPPSPLRILEALVFVGGAPLTAERACETIRGLTPAQFDDIIDTLNRDYRRQGRPYWIQAQKTGHVLTLRSRFRAVHERLYGGTREARLSPQAI